MTNEKNNGNNNNVSRRNFLKGGAILGATIGLSSLSSKQSTEEITKALGKKEVDSFPYEIAPDYKRYAQKNLTFTRLMFKDPSIMALMEGLPGYHNVLDDTQPGYTTLDHALEVGSASVNDTFAPASAGGNPNTPMYTWDAKPAEHKYEFASKEDASKAIKKAAKFYGASLVGITAYDEKWVYDPIIQLITEDGKPKELSSEKDFPFQPKSVIVMAFEMDYEGMSTAPSTLEEATTMLGYSNMAEVNFKVSSFIRALGYKAFGAGNDTAMSVPYAIAAGLGEQGRQGLLITYEYGPRVRLCKVFTEMDLAYDKPVKFGANQFCQVCKKCAYTCPSQSISLDDEMAWAGVGYESISNQVGVKKYYVNVETCYQYWNTCGNDCGCCIASCPFNKPDFWHHRITTAMTGTPLKPFLNEMDDLFGYGDVFNKDSAIKFWGLDSYAK